MFRVRIERNKAIIDMPYSLFLSMQECDENKTGSLRMHHRMHHRISKLPQKKLNPFLIYECLGHFGHSNLS